MAKTVTTDKDGRRFEWDRETGETGLYYPNGEYFRSVDDYDHGWIYKHPGMTYSQKRRSKSSVFWNRASMVFMAFCFVVVPFCWAVAFGMLTTPWAAAPFYVVVQSFAALLFIKKIVQDDLFDFVWHGRMH